jgi:hypothetical protein
MEWADYRKGVKKAKTHLGFDLNRGVPRKIFRLVRRICG